MPPLGDRAALRARRDGGSPLLTHYRPDRGERVELSATSLANWVDKTANLLDGLGIDADSDVALPVLVEHPGAWMGLVLPLACWQRGIGVRVVGRSDARDADLAVLGPDDPEPLATDTLACSLHPWGLALQGLPDGVTDFSTAALAEADVHVAEPAAAEAHAWTDAARTVRFGTLAALEPLDRRVLLRPADPWAASSTLWRALSGTGSVVLVDGDADEAVLAQLAASERAVSPTGR